MDFIKIKKKNFIKPSQKVEEDIEKTYLRRDSFRDYRIF